MEWVCGLVVLMILVLVYVFRYQLLWLVSDREMSGDAREEANKALVHWVRAERHDNHAIRKRSMEMLNNAIGTAVAARMGGEGAIRYWLAGKPQAREMFKYYDAHSKESPLP